nr:hypothetical protein [Tanacetum cinerariifolium]
YLLDICCPLILGRPFLSTTHAIINVHEKETIIRQDQQSLTIQCGDILSIKKVEQINKIDFINAGGITFESEEIENFLNDDSIPLGVEDSPFNMDEDILFLESLLREDPIPPHPIIPNQTKLPIEEPKHSFKMRKNQEVTCRLHQLNGDVVHNQPTSSSFNEEINDVTITDDMLPPSVENDDSDEEVDADSDCDNPPVPLPPPEPPDKEFNFEIAFEKEISIVRSAIVKFECIDARVKFDVFNDENDDLSYFMFVIFDKKFSLLSTESEHTIFDLGISE